MKHPVPALRRVLHALFETACACVSPPRCRACGLPLFAHANPYLCAGCAEEIAWIGANACAKCGFPAETPFARRRNGCDRCRGKNLRLDEVVAVARYRRGVRNLIRAFKYGGEAALARPMAGIMAARLREADFFGNLDVIAPVALHPARKRGRGFDQAWILADRLREETGIAVRSDLLERRMLTVPQARLRRAERLRNMEGVFRAREDCVRGKQVLLVDDVMTTGSTMADCARACREAGATGVYAVVFAR